MSDRELLKLAAKAAGLVGYEYCRSDQGDYEYMAFDEGGSKSDYWNPLTADGDAFRLAAKLRLPISYQHRFGSVQFAPVRKVLVPPHWTVTASRFSSENMEADPFAATRRAIVRAAAEIGRTKGD